MGLAQSCLTDADINVGADGQVDSAGLTRNDAARIGDVAIYEPCAPPTPALTRLKRQVDPVCLPGAECTFEVLLTNAGPSGWNGIPRIMDTPPLGTVLLSASFPWRCIPVASVRPWRRVSVQGLGSVS